MADWTRTDLITLVAPELSAVASPTVDAYIALADNRLAVARFPAGSTLRKWAGMYLTAHLLTLTPPTGAAAGSPAVKSESAGGVSVTYAIPDFQQGELGLTRFGLAFASLARPRVCGGAVT